VGTNVASRWVKQSRSGGVRPSKPHAPASVFTADEYKQILTEKNELYNESNQFKRTLGEQTLEVSILRDLLKKQTLTCGQNRDCKEVDSPGVWSQPGAAHCGGITIH